jgi:tol-pal system protein YbgF
MKTITQVIYLTLTLVGPLALTSVNVSAAAPVTDLSSDSPNDRLSRLERLIEQSHQRQLTTQQQLDTLLEEVNLLRGDTEVHSHKLGQLVERQRELYQELEDRFSRFSAGTQTQPNIQTAELGSSTAEPLTEQAPEIVYTNNISENDAYDKAMNLVLKERRYDKAIPEFRAFIKAFPDSDYAPNAYYWLGQLLFNKGSYDESKIQFERVANYYPDSNNRSDAILKLGSIALKNNVISGAKRNFEKVISEYPGTTSAKLAASRLQTLK